MKRISSLVLAVSLLLSGCDWFADPQPDEAKLVIEGDAGKPVRIIISTSFLAAVNENGQTRVTVLVSDTVISALPYTKTYHIENEQRFFVEASRLDADVPNVRMQVFVDDDRKFDGGGTLVTGQPMRFIYLFQQPLSRDIVVL